MTKNGIKRNAFTIVEVLVVGAIVVIVASAGIIGIYENLDSTVLRSGSLALQQAARFARLMAGEKHYPCSLRVNLDDGTYRLAITRPGKASKRNEQKDDNNYNTEDKGILNTFDVYSQTRRLPETLHFSQVCVEDNHAKTAGEVSIKFNVDGSAQAALIQINCKDKTNTLLISPCTSRSELYDMAIYELPVDKIDLDKPGTQDGL